GGGEAGDRASAGGATGNIDAGPPAEGGIAIDGGRTAGAAAGRAGAPGGHAGGAGGTSSGAGGANAGGGSAGTGASDKYYVGGANASDSNPGTSTLPFATIQKCATMALPGDTCHINSGVYRETVTPALSGTAGAPITFAAVAGAQVTIDGTDSVTGWTLDSGKIYKAAIELAGTATQLYSSTEYPSNGDLWANQIFIGTAVVPEAAYPTPSADPWAQAFVSGFSSTNDNPNACVTPPCTTVVSGTLTYNSFPVFGDMTGAVAYFAGGWVALSATVTGGSLTSSNHTLTISFPQSDSKVFPGGGNDGKVRLIGKKTFLAGANEWFYDPAVSTLYLWTPSGTAPENVFAKKRNYAFDLRGSSYVDVSNISLFASTIVTDTNSAHVILDGLRGQYLSHWQTAQYDTTLPFAGIYDANHRFDSGIVLHGTNNILQNSSLHLSTGNGVNILGSGTVVTNNTIYDVAYGGTYTAAITIEVGSHDLTITNNTAYSTGRDVINMNTNAYPNPGYKNVHIAYNNIYDYARVDYDLGGIYTCCDTALTGTRIDHNWIHDPANAGNGLHFDNGTYDLEVDHNVIWNVKGTGSGINFGGHTNRPPSGTALPYLTGAFYNNTIVTAENMTFTNYFAKAAQDANMTVRNNILDGDHPAGQDWNYIPGGIPVEDHNLVTLFSMGGTGTNPKYNNSAGADFSLQATSPAINAGTVIAGVTDGYLGAAPDQGAYEYGQPIWKAGSTTAP
ncbi:MAG TPA: right-handed parallel beta-helix repeat-containing protein, partial [Polyangia bacterium]|nr:right-handed parallel beta-helix repeat-containing protein [Polyangia bacterium]